MGVPCERANCTCTIKPGGGFESQGKVYCCKVCAEVCTDEKCSCTPCDCPQ